MRHNIVKGILPTIFIILPIGILLAALMLFFSEQMTLKEVAAIELIEHAQLQSITVIKGDLCPQYKCMHLLYQDKQSLAKACVFINPPNPNVYMDLPACEHNELHLSALNQALQDDKPNGLLNQ